MSATSANERGAYRHEAFFYAGEDEFLAEAIPFIETGIEAGETVQAALPPEKRRLLRLALSDRAERVHFLPIEEIGRNPARLIPAWRDFLSQDGRLEKGTRGLGEPVWPGRSPAEIEEVERHERIINLAFGGYAGLTFLCPYNATALDDDVLSVAESSHAHGASGSDLHLAPEFMLAGSLPPPKGPATTLHFDRTGLRAVRAIASERARLAELDSERAEDLVLAVSELAANSILHGGGEGTLEIWRERDQVVCEVRDAGRIRDPLVGRQRPSPEQAGGRGLWIANQVCDLVQIRSGKAGTQVRLRMSPLNG